ncbi:MAG: hypothetical protein D6718_04715 [Acidobacteria bacterium]|nr:MAG: hypothetical protein D6718_04715 [Acidobacteriota bacterium]
MNPMRPAVTGARWMAYLGLACGILYSVGGCAVDLATVGFNRGTVLAFGALVGMPAIFAAAGFGGGFLFGLAARAIGGGGRTSR